jgi:hypothetical protein
MSLQLQTFPNFSAAMFAAFSAKIKADTGAVITSNVGTIVHGSFTFTYNFNPSLNQLQVQCLKKPIFLPASTVTNGLAEEVLEIQQQVLEAVAKASSVPSPEVPAAMES